MMAWPSYMLIFLLLVTCYVSYVVGDVLSKEAKAALLEKHNNHRRKIAKGEEFNKDRKNMPKASNMEKMVYNPALEQKAEEWAKKCEFGHTPQIDYGQNLYSVSKKVSDVKAVTKAGDSWWKELSKKFTSTDVLFTQEMSDRGVGHFTQMAWANNRRIGCAVQNCDFGTFVICNYDNGNKLQNNIYEVGEPCSNCPAGTTCEDGLCAVQCNKSKRRRK